MSPTLAARRARRVLYVSVAIGTALLVIGFAYAMAALLGLTQAVRDTQLEGTPTGRKLVASADRILDCTEPEGECFKQGQERTAKAVGDINRVIVLAAACAAGLPDGLSDNQRVIRTQQCLIDQLAMDKDG